VREVVPHEQRRALEPEVRLGLQRQHEALGQPGRKGAYEVPERERERQRVVGQDPLQLQERLLVEYHEVHVEDGDVARLQARVDRAHRERGAALHPVEALLLGRGHLLPVADQARRRSG
jgi:hypothetical protein